MIDFEVNGRPVRFDGTMNLMKVLREQLHLVSVKNGCAQGACGSCMVLVDGQAKKACTLKVAQIKHCQVLTVEGLSDREKTVYAYAFSQSGAVQCGFCTPGMVISAKGLLDRQPQPTLQEVRQALKPNLCRCTGYKKIEAAVLMAASLLRSGAAVPLVESPDGVGFSLPRVDAQAKALGRAEYVDDLQPEGMLLGGAVRSMNYPRARVVRLDVSRARALPGVVAVLTAEDIPGAKKIGHIKKDWDVLIGLGSVTHCLGDPVVLIAAIDEPTLDQARALVEVEYEALPSVHSPEAALKADFHIHEGGNVLTQERLVRGQARAKIQASVHVVTQRYQTPFTEHAFLEPETALALPEEGGEATLRIYCADQGIYQTRKECAEMLGLPLEQVRVISKMVGGGFGGKEDMSVQHHAALLAFHTGRPVKVSLTRDESILIHPKRHAMELEFTTACDEEGYLTAMVGTIVADTGAYASLGGPVLQRACTHAAGPYNYQDIEITGTAVYTNNPPAGAFRGFGVTQSCFATECNLDLLAQKVGISPWEIRYRNRILPGQYLPNGQLADESTALEETLLAIKPFYDAFPDSGLACAMKNSGLGVGLPDIGRCNLKVSEGRVQLATSAACIGQGMATVITQIVAETTGLSLNHLEVVSPDTSITPDSGNTTASRQTLFTGEAARQAAEALRKALKAEGGLEALEGRLFEGTFSATTDAMGSQKEHPVSHVAYSYATHMVKLDSETGRIQQIWAAHDVGRAINPVNLEGQIEGGVTMSMGYALTEDFPLDQGRPKAKMGTLGLLRSTEVPEIHPIIVEKKISGPAFGAKGIGEISAIATAPAIQNAYFQRDGILRNVLPLGKTPYSRKKENLKD